MMQCKEEYGHALLRWAMGLVFLIFGIMQIYSPSVWTSYIPNFLSSSASIMVFLNGSIEIFLALLLLFGLYTRLASLLLGIHLFIISVSIGFNALALRDMGLAFATLAIVFFKPDRFSLDAKKINKNRCSSLSPP